MRIFFDNNLSVLLADFPLVRICNNFRILVFPIDETQKFQICFLFLLKRLINLFPFVTDPLLAQQLFCITYSPAFRCDIDKLFEYLRAYGIKSIAELFLQSVYALRYCVRWSQSEVYLLDCIEELAWVIAYKFLGEIMGNLSFKIFFRPTGISKRLL